MTHVVKTSPPYRVYTPPINYLERCFVTLSQVQSVILQREILQRMKDSGRFTILCTIGQVHFDHTLFDLGASVNIMLSSIFKKLEIG